MCDVTAHPINFKDKWDGADICFIVQGTKVYANKTIVAMSSPVFENLIRSNSKEEMLTMMCKNLDDVIMLLQFLHPPSLRLNSNVVQVLLPMAHEYQLNELFERCEAFLLDNEKPSIDKCLLAQEFGLDKLLCKNKKYLISSDVPVETLRNNTEFKKLSADTIFEVLLAKCEESEKKRYGQVNESSKVLHYVSKLDLIRHPEGGYFREFYRSGSKPMSTKGLTDFNVASALTCTANGSFVPYNALSDAPGRQHLRPDGDIRRNCLTSIIWVPTDDDPLLKLVINVSDVVHYWQGGKSFEYFIYDPETGVLSRMVLGPNVDNGERLQVPVRGGLWKCGGLLDDRCKTGADYCLIGEAVAPGFDFHDMSWVTPAQIETVLNPEHKSKLSDYIHKDIQTVSGDEVNHAAAFYD